MELTSFGGDVEEHCFLAHRRREVTRDVVRGCQGTKEKYSVVRETGVAEEETLALLKEMCGAPVTKVVVEEEGTQRGWMGWKGRNVSGKRM